MSEPMEKVFLTPATATLYLSQIELKNFGWFQDGSFKFSPRMNLIEGDNEKGRMTLLKALEILLLPTKGGSVSVDEIVAGKRMITRDGSCPSVITGYFEELTDSGESSGIEHSLRVTISKLKRKAVVKFHWDGTPRPVSQMRDLLAKYGFHQTSVFFLSDETITMENLGPMKFLRRRLDEVPSLQTIRRNHGAIESLRKGLLEKIELYEMTSSACQRIKEKIGNLLDPNFKTSALELRKAELERCARYSELTDLQERVRLTEGDIKKYEIRFERAKKKVGKEGKKRRAQKKEIVSNFVPAEIGDDDSSRRTLGSMLENLRMEFEKLHVDDSMYEGPRAVSGSVNAQRSFLEKMRRDEKEFLKLNTALLKTRLAKRSVTTRLNLLNNTGEPMNDEKWRERILKATIEFSQSLLATNRSEKQELERKLTWLRECLREASAQRDELVAEAADKEKELKTCCDSEIIEEFAIRELKDRMTGVHCDGELIAAPSVACSTQLLPEIFSVLEMLGVDESEWASFGYFGFVQDHIEVESEFRILMQRFKGLLGSLVVRDFDVAYKLWSVMKELKFEDTVNVICLNDYEAPRQQFQTPDKTDHLSSFVKIKQRGRIVIDGTLRSKLEKIIAHELRHYFVIRGQRTDVSAIAEKLLEEPQWEVCKFLATDGSCFSLEEWSGPPEGEDPMTAYEVLSERLYSVRSQIAGHAHELQRLKAAKKDHLDDHAKLLNLIGIEDTKIANIHAEMKASESLLKLLTDKTSEIESYIEVLQTRLVDAGGEHGHGRKRSLRKELEAGLRSLDSDLEVAEEKKRELDDSISKSIEAMAVLLIYPSTENAGLGDDEISRSPASKFKSDICRIEELMAKLSFEYVGNNEDESVEKDPHPSRQGGLAGLSRNESEAIELQTTLFLLERKLDSLRKRITAVGDIDRPSNWDAKRNYAEELEGLNERRETEARLAITDGARRELEKLAETAPKIHCVTKEAVETLVRLFNLSRERALRPKLEQEALTVMVERLKRNFAELAPRGELRVVQDAESQSSSGGGRRVRKKPRVNDVDSQSTSSGGETVEVSFNAEAYKPRFPMQLSGGEGAVLGLSVLLSQAALSPARFLLLDDVDAPLDYSAQSRFAKFINNFEPRCQIFVLSHKAPEGSLAADKRVLINTDK